MPSWKNWSGNLHCEPHALVSPHDKTALQDAVAAAKQLRVAGSGHSFSPVVPTDVVLLQLDQLSGVSAADRATRRARIGAGTAIADIGGPLLSAGLALRNQGDIDRQSMAGAVATATHGTGRSLPCIAASVTALEWVDARGDLRTVSVDEDPDLLSAVTVALGSVGVLTEIEVACEPRYNLRERTWTQSLDDALDDFQDLSESHRHCEFFAFPFTGLASVKTLTREPFSPVPRSEMREAGTSSGFTRLIELNREDPKVAREQLQAGLERAVPSEEVGPSHRIFPSDREDRFNEMEYAVPLEEGVSCLRQVLRAIEKADLPVVFPIEYRTVAADELWLSPFYRRDSAVIAVHQDATLPSEPIFECVEPILRRHEGRPHWGKIHSLTADELAGLYPRWSDFQELRRDHDPGGKFLNTYLRRIFGE